MSEENSNRIFTSSKGVDIRLRPVSQFKLGNIRESQKEVTIPTYTVKPVAGPEQEFPLDEEVAESRGRMDEWNDYLARKNKSDAAHSKKFSSLLIWEGVSVDVPGPDSEWQSVSDFFEIELPTNPIERKIRYVYDELIGSPSDFGELIAAILDVSQMDQEVVDNLRASFRFGAGRKAHSRMAPEKEPVESEGTSIQPA